MPPAGWKDPDGARTGGSSRVFFKEIDANADGITTSSGSSAAATWRRCSARRWTSCRRRSSRPWRSSDFQGELEADAARLRRTAHAAPGRGERHAELGGARIYIKLEGLAHTGAHKINNAIGQALLARRMGKTRIIAETGAGQHGVATAAVCARLGIPCRVYMGEVDMRRQRPNVFWMERYGAEVVPVEGGSATLKDAVNEALRDWARASQPPTTSSGSALGPSPYPDMVREFQSVIGRELDVQIGRRGSTARRSSPASAAGRTPSVSSPRSSSRRSPELIGVEAGGRGIAPGEHAARMNGRGRPGIVQGYKSLFLSDDDGQLLPTHSISAGLDYPGIGPQLAHLGKREDHASRRPATRRRWRRSSFFARTEGLVFALESAHAAAAAIRLARAYPRERAIVVNMSGRGTRTCSSWPARWTGRTGTVPCRGVRSGKRRAARQALRVSRPGGMER